MLLAIFRMQIRWEKYEFRRLFLVVLAFPVPTGNFYVGELDRTTHTVIVYDSQTMWHEPYYGPYNMVVGMPRITNLTKYFSSHCIVHWWSGKVETTSYAPKNLSCPKYPVNFRSQIIWSVIWVLIEFPICSTVPSCCYPVYWKFIQPKNTKRAKELQKLLQLPYSRDRPERSRQTFPKRK